MRLLVIGTSCSGKTTFARSVSKSCGIPHIELDELFWGPDWTPTPRDQFLERVSQAVSEEAWVLDGNYSYAQDISWPRATHLVWLNLPFGLVLWRSLKRTFGRMITGEEMFAGNKESLRVAFSRHSIVWWVISTYRRRQNRYRRIFQENRFPHLEMVEISKPSETRGVLLKLCFEAFRKSI